MPGREANSAPIGAFQSEKAAWSTSPSAVKGVAVGGGATLCKSEGSKQDFILMWAFSTGASLYLNRNLTLPHAITG